MRPTSPNPFKLRTKVSLTRYGILAPDDRGVTSRKAVLADLHSGRLGVG